MAMVDAETIWKEAFPNDPRPVLYVSQERDEDGFRPLADPQTFAADIANLSHAQLYTISSNAQLALQQAQEEYLEINNQIAIIKGREPHKKDPQALLDHEEFEERKEAQLYSYKYEPPKPALLHNGVPGNRSADDLTEQEKRDVRLFQEPFSQGGFVPTERQYKGMLSRAKSQTNIDNWQPIERNGKHLVPVQQLHHDEFTATYTRRNVDENGELIRPDSEASDDSFATPSKLVDKRLTRTRFGGRKVPPTRDASEAPSIASTSTPGKRRAATSPVSFDARESTPNTKRRRVDHNDPNRPKHPNQYTKARERRLAEEAAAAARAAGLPVPPNQPQHHSMTTQTNYANAPSGGGGSNIDWSTLSKTQLRSRKGWTDADLVAAIKQDYRWLHDDPARALEWRDKILNGTNPVRSWSMVKKWEEWKVGGLDKRPRKRERVIGENGGGGAGSAGGKEGTPASLGSGFEGSEERVRSGEGLVDNGMGESIGDVANGGVDGVNGNLDGQEESDIAPRRSGRLQR